MTEEGILENQEGIRDNFKSKNIGKYKTVSFSSCLQIMFDSWGKNLTVPDVVLKYVEEIFKTIIKVKRYKSG